MFSFKCVNFFNTQLSYVEPCVLGTATLYHPPPSQIKKNKTTVCYCQEYDVSSPFRAGAHVMNSVVLNPARELSDVQPVRRFPRNPKLNTMFGLRRIQCIFFAQHFFAITLPFMPTVHQSDVSFLDLRISDLSNCHIPTRRFPLIYVNS
jgi:hypothetical protein